MSHHEVILILVCSPYIVELSLCHQIVSMNRSLGYDRNLFFDMWIVGGIRIGMREHCNRNCHKFQNYSFLSYKHFVNYVQTCSSLYSQRFNLDLN